MKRKNKIIQISKILLLIFPINRKGKYTYNEIIRKIPKMIYEKTSIRDNAISRPNTVSYFHFTNINSYKLQHIHISPFYQTSINFPS